MLYKEAPSFFTGPSPIATMYYDIDSKRGTAKKLDWHGSDLRIAMRSHNGREIPTPTTTVKGEARS